MSGDIHPLWMPVQVGQLRLRSRLVLPPMASETGDADGRVTDETVTHYERIVGPNQGLAFVEYTYVHASGRSEPRQLGLTDPGHVEGLARIARNIAAKGAVPGIQLTHAGGKTDAALIGRAPLGASPVAIPAHGGDLPAPEPMTGAEVEELAEAFVTAAERAVAAGFRAIEIHAAHGYFFNQWLSPITNQRADGHGGSLAARAFLLLDVIRRIRAAVGPEILLSLRFPGQDRLEGGLTPEDGYWLAQAVEAAGIDVLNVSSGLGGWRRQRGQRGEGYLVADAAALRQVVAIPVIGVGGIATLDYAEKALNEGKADLLAVGRAILDNPAWPAA